MRQEGFEPPTHSSEGCCSIQLSYWRLSPLFFVVLYFLLSEGLLSIAAAGGDRSI